MSAPGDDGDDDIGLLPETFVFIVKRRRLHDMAKKRTGGKRERKKKSSVAYTTNNNNLTERVEEFAPPRAYSHLNFFSGDKTFARPSCRRRRRLRAERTSILYIYFTRMRALVFS